MNNELADIATRLHEDETTNNQFLTREMWATLAEHEDCTQCAPGQPCAPIAILGRLLRVDQFRHARTAAQALAEDARQLGAPVLTVLRRPELDGADRSCTSTPSYPDVELFGFEIVLPRYAVPVTVPGCPLADFRNIDFTGSGRQRPLVYLRRRALGFEDAARRIADEAQRMSTYE